MSKARKKRGSAAVRIYDQSVRALLLDALFPLPSGHVSHDAHDGVWGIEYKTMGVYSPRVRSEGWAQ